MKSNAPLINKNISNFKKEIRFTVELEENTISDGKHLKGLYHHQNLSYIS